MKNGEFRLPIAILAFILILGLLLGSFTLYNKLGIVEPLSKKLYLIEAVDEVNIDKDKLYNIEIKLGKLNDVQKTYQEIITTIETKLDNDAYQLKILDNSNSKLDELLISLQPAIYEALASHQFIWLDEHLNSITEKMEVSHLLFVDDENLYIQLIDADSYIYSILERPSGVYTKTSGGIK
ncbi:MAG TPA: hypothetical protein VFC73_04895 [Syntrophomonadaceae bacterium]|nr:hypothetical protein [Syntrophomonadaceae bacterium]